MVLLYVALLVVCLIGIKWRKPVASERSYLDKSQTKNISGIFVVIVLFSHFSSYVIMQGRLNEWFTLINGKIGQLMVTMFLFYSGYGIMTSIKRKKREYINAFVIHRAIPVYSRFFVSVILFLIIDAILGYVGTKYSIIECLLAFTAWTSVGNSTWFMFCTFALYIFVFVSFKICKTDNYKIPLIVLTILSLVYVLLFALVLRKGVWWYNTILCFPFGMWFSYFVEKADKVYLNNKLWIVSLLISVLMFVGCYFIQDKIPYGLGYLPYSIIFTIIVLLITMRFKIGNRILSFFGSHVFSVYMLQRITYIVFENIITNPYLFFAICFAVTILLAVAFDFVFDKLFKKILKKIK